MTGTPDLTTALVLAGLFVALLLALLSYHNPRRNYVGWGTGLLILCASLALLAHALAQPSVGTALLLALLLLGAMLVLTTYQGTRPAHLAWLIGVLVFLLALPFLGTGRGDLALLALIAGPGLLMLVAALYPEIPARYARLGATDVPEAITPEELIAERRRYTRLAATITVASLAGIWLFGGIPQGPVTEAAAPLVVDEAMAARGLELFQQYGCNACHSVTGQAGAGPTLKGVAGHRVRMDDGSEVRADEAYIRESILQPDAKTVNGFGKGVMVGAIGSKLPDISQAQNFNALVEYVKSLGK